MKTLSKIKNIFYDFFIKIFPLRESAKKRRHERNKRIFLFCMLLVPILNFIIFWLFVNFNSILIAFQNNSGGWTLFNFRWFFDEVFRQDSVLIEALINTLKFFSLSSFVILPLTIFLAYFLFKKIFLYKFFRVVFFLPSIISAVVLTTVFKSFISPNGPFSIILQNLGVSQVPEFLANSEYAMWACLAYCLWTGFGTNMILFGGAFSRIPEEILESAKLDGVSSIRELFQIMLPLIWPTISTILIFAIVGIFSSSGPILLLTKGNYGTMTISYWIFDQVDRLKSYAIPSAAGLIFTLIGVPVVLITKHFLDKVNNDVEY